ncbi:MAG: hypothetical protein WCL71_01330 [Deltaproteobacteria bacterium]
MRSILMLIALSLFVSSTVFAAAGTSQTMDTDLTASTKLGKSLYGDKTAAAATTALIGKTSTGVGVGVLTSAAGYAIVVQHLNGTKAFGTSFDSTSMFSIEATKGAAKLAVPTAVTTADFTATGWSAM